MDLFNAVRDREAGRISGERTAKNGCATVSRWAVATGSRLAGLEGWEIEAYVLTRRAQRYCFRSSDLRVFCLVGGVYGPRRFDGLGQAAADGSQNEGGDGALRRESEIGGLAREFGALVQAHANFSQEFGGKTHVLGAIDAPEPELFFMALQEIEGLL
jgi:hypothetical protein